MIALAKPTKLAKTDVPIIKIPGLCIGALTGPTGEISQTHCRQNQRGTAHINIRQKTNSRSFLEL